MLDEKSVQQNQNNENKENIEYLYRIRCRYHVLSKKGKKIADYLCTHKHDSFHLSINQLAEKTGTNAPAITRFAQTLGFSGYSELKFYIEKELLSPYAQDNTVTGLDSMAVIKQKVMAQDKEIIDQSISMFDNNKLEKAIESIASASKVELFAEGGSASNASALYNMLLQLFIPCRMYTDAFLAITSASQLTSSDTALSISYSGSSINSVNFLKEAKKHHAKTIAITGYINSPLANAADIVLITSTNIRNDLRDMHVVRMSELCCIGILQVGLYVRMESSILDKIQSLTEATRLTRLKSGYDVLF